MNALAQTIAEALSTVWIAESSSQYRLALRAPTRALWAGLWTPEEFDHAFEGSIERNLTIAWSEGLAAGGVTLAEQTFQERMELLLIITTQQVFVPKFRNAIVAGSKANKGKLGALFTRLDMWVNVYQKTVDQAKAHALANQKVKWFLGATKKHCRSCAGFAGRVYRRSTWAANNALTRSPALACTGRRCDCELEPTDERVTPGKFPQRLLGLR